jgi:hypothetical protein
VISLFGTLYVSIPGLALGHNPDDEQYTKSIGKENEESVISKDPLLGVAYSGHSESNETIE